METQTRSASAIARSIKREERFRVVVRPHVRGLALFAIGFVFAYRFGMSFTQELAAPFWFPDSVLLCALIINPPNTWWMYIAVTVPIRLFMFVPPGAPFWYLLACLANDSLKGLLSAWLLRQVSRPAVWLDNVRDFTRYFLVAVVLAPALSAVTGAPLRVYFGDRFWRAGSHWFFGDALASLMLTPLLVCFVTDRRRFSRRGLRRYLAALSIVAGLMAAGYLALRGSGNHAYPPFLWYLPVPFLLWAAMSFGPIGTSLGLSLVSVVAIFETVSGRGPFNLQSGGAALFSIQLFLFFLSVPFMFLSVLSKQQRATDASLRESEQRFRSLVDTAPVMVWMCGTEAQCTFLNKPWLDFTGRPLTEQLGTGWMECIHPEDRQKCAETCRFAFETKESFVAEYRLMRNGGDYRWILDHGAPRFEPDGTFRGFIGTCVDITDRKEAEVKLRQLSSQLIQAQETERFRIGQELHDDISQRAAAIALRLSHLSRNYHHNQTLTAEFDRLRQQTIDLCTDIARVSHQLHPVTLTRLGLTMALRSLCAQLTDDKRTVLFTGDDALPQLADDAAVALYRVAQEALRNALTHSGASHIYVELNATKTKIKLSIRDTGRGFDVGSVATVGLGLSGMAERMRNGNGSLTIVSNSDSGTTITATVPILKSRPATG